jgi:anion-transporting  ArsA/GET3 family ATPase
VKDLLDRKLVFVTGKGGVGKTTTAGALALLCAQRGQRTLVCDFDAKGDLADFFETGSFSFRPREIHPGLFAMSMDTEASLHEYLTLQLRLPTRARIGPLARALEFVANAAPGVKEILTVGKVVWEVREGHWDMVVVDASATGHIVGQLGAPQAINELVSVGPVRQQTSWLMHILGDHAITGLCIVVTPEEMPVNETIELSHKLKEKTNVELAAVVVNRVLPELFGRREEEIFDELRTPALTGALSKAVGGPADTVLEAADLAVTLRRTKAGHLEHLRESIDPSVAVLYVPEMFSRRFGLRALRQVSQALSGELGY